MLHFAIWEQREKPVISHQLWHLMRQPECVSRCRTRETPPSLHVGWTKPIFLPIDLSDSKPSLHQILNTDMLISPGILRYRNREKKIKMIPPVPQEYEISVLHHGQPKKKSLNQKNFQPQKYFTNQKHWKLLHIWEISILKFPLVSSWKQ